MIAEKFMQKFGKFTVAEGCQVSQLPFASDIIRFLEESEWEILNRYDVLNVIFEEWGVTDKASWDAWLDGQLQEGINIVDTLEKLITELKTMKDGDESIIGDMEKVKADYDREFTG